MTFIHRIEITPLLFPLKKPFSNHAHTLTHIHGLDVRIITKDFMGCSFTYGLRKSPYTDVIKYIEAEITPTLFDIDSIDALQPHWSSFWTSYRKDNTEQEKTYALSAIDIAIWDLLTKAKKISLHQYLGAAQPKAFVYATTGWLSFSSQELIDECTSYGKQGISAFKVRLGHQDDYSRVQTLRKEMGDNLVLMLDANQRYSAEQAIQISNELVKFNITWLEEPTNYSSEELERVKKGSKIPLAIGESILNEHDFERICEKELTDYLQPDLPRCGGITGFCRVAEIALKYKLPLCSHLMPQLSASLIAAYPNGYMVEYDNLLPPGIFVHTLSVHKGSIILPNLPGTGVELTQQALKQFGIHTYILESKRL